MEEELEVILRAVDDASSTFESVADSAEQMGNSIETAGDGGLDDVINDTESLQTAFDQATAEVERLKSELEFSEDYGFDDVDELSAQLAEAEAEAERLGTALQEATSQGSEGFKEVEDSAEGAEDPISQIGTLLEGFVGVEIFSQLADALWDVADKAGTFEDSLMRARLEAEGAGIPVNEMTDAVSELSRTTGRAGSEIRESFIKATARGITDMNSFKQMMEGAGAQATLLGTDIQSMGDKFSSMAMRSTLMERQLASTGITMEELASAMGMTGATADEVKAKWEELDTNQRAATLGMAASMNEGKTANEEYKKSWAGLQQQLDIAKGRLERLAGEVLLPVLVPALQVAGRVLNWLGDTVSAVMSGPFGGLISVVGAAAAAFALAVPAYMAVQGAITLLTATAIPAATALWGMVAPLLPFIAIGAAVVLIIYEIGEAFGWWSDTSSMLDAIWAGVQRLWSAFINHPDVQSFLSALASAWNWLVPAVTGVVNAVLRFFGVTSSSNFDFVRTLIAALGVAWQALTLPIRTVITVIKLLWTTMRTVYNNIKTTLNNIKKIFTNLPGAIRGAISGLLGIITKPFKDAYNKIKGTVDSIKTKAKSITNISLSSLTDKIFGPVRDAYNKIKEKVDQIKAKIKEIPVVGDMFGGADLAYGGEDLTTYTTEEMKVSMTQDINLSLDLSNVPTNVDENRLYDIVGEAMTSKEFIQALAQNNDFQSVDRKVKARINAKTRRARGA